MDCGKESTGKELSVVKDISEIEEAVVKCFKCCTGGTTSYHCPLCPVEKFKPNRKPNVLRHLRSHLERGFKYRELLILCCDLKCEGSKGGDGHYHCSQCSIIKDEKEEMERHLKSECKPNKIVDGIGDSVLGKECSPKKRGRKPGTKNYLGAKKARASPEDDFVKKIKEDQFLSTPRTSSRLQTKRQLRAERGEPENPAVAKLLEPLPTYREIVTTQRKEGARGQPGRPRLKPIKKEPPSPEVLQEIDKNTEQLLSQVLKPSESAEIQTEKIFSSIAAVLSSELYDRNSENCEKAFQEFAKDTKVNFTFSGDDVVLYGDLDALKNAQDFIAKLVRPKTREKQGLPNDEEKNSTTDNLIEGEPNLNEMEQEAVSIVSHLAGDLGQNYLEEADDDLDEDFTGPRLNMNPRCTLIKDPNKANYNCEVCGYMSTLEGVRKHKLRHHSQHQFQCDICQRSFGIKYDMRRHRVLHFDQEGKMLSSAVKLMQKHNPDGELLTLHELEEGFQPESIETQSIETENKIVSVSQDETEKGAEVLDGDTEKTDHPDPNTETKGSEEIGADSVHGMDNSPNSTQDSSLKGQKSQEILCSFCDEYLDEEEMDQHRLEVHPVIDYLCVYCQELFIYCQDLEQHLKEQHSEQHSENVDADPKEDTKKDIVAVCKRCHFKGKIKDVESHYLTVHQSFRHTCVMCPKSFLSKKQLVDHMALIHPKVSTAAKKFRMKKLPKEKIEMISCQLCDKQVLRKNLNGHMRCHKTDKRFPCEHCDFMASRKTELHHHVRKTHPLTLSQVCELCGQVFAVQSSLKFHKKTVHGDSKNKIKCETCGKEFQDVRFLRVHNKRIHLKEKRYFCDICNKGFFEKVRMLDHKQVHLTEEEREARKPHQCKYCDRKFMQKIQMRQHENTHTGEKPWKCKICNKAFAWAAEVTKHMSIHREVHPFTCTKCGRGFKFHYKLKTHMLSHSNEGKHKCDLCQKTFTAKATMKRHKCKSVPQVPPGTQFLVLHSSPTQDSGNSSQYKEILAIQESTPVLPQQEAVPTEQEESGTDVLYMCGMCNGLFDSRQDVDQHMLEHGNNEQTESSTEGAVQTIEDPSSTLTESTLETVVEKDQSNLKESDSSGHDTSETISQVLVDEDGKMIAQISESGETFVMM